MNKSEFFIRFRVHNIFLIVQWLSSGLIVIRWLVIFTCAWSDVFFISTTLSKHVKFLLLHRFFTNGWSEPSYDSRTGHSHILKKINNVYNWNYSCLFFKYLTYHQFLIKLLILLFMFGACVFDNGGRLLYIKPEW